VIKKNGFFIFTIELKEVNGQIFLRFLKEEQIILLKIIGIQVIY
jgi:hypothetical protein